MNGLTIEATVINGQILLPAGINLPENSKVLVVLSEASAPSARVISPRLKHADQAESFTMHVREA